MFHIKLPAKLRWHLLMPALTALLGYYRNNQCHHLHLSPADIDVVSIGHFAWFHERFREILWPLILII